MSRCASLLLMLMFLAISRFPAIAQNAPGAASTGGHAALSGSGNSALSGVPDYDPRLTFAPLSLPSPVNAYRSSNGAPGPKYWQNEADYELHATLEPANKLIHATEVITYTNNSPDVLPSVWV